MGQGHELNVNVLEATRLSTIGYELAKHLLYHHYADPFGAPKMHLFSDLKRIANRWLAEDYLECSAGTKPAMVLYPELKERACN